MQKFRFYLRFSVVGVPPFRSFRGSYRGVRIALSVAVADGFMPRKVLGRQKGVCRNSSSFIYNVDAIDRAINENRQISFLYFNYDEKNENAYRKT